MYKKLLFLLSTTLHNSILLTEAAKFSLLYIIYKHCVSFDKLTSVHEPQITFIHHSIITSLFPEKKQNCYRFYCQVIAHPLIFYPL